MTKASGTPPDAPLPGLTRRSLLSASAIGAGGVALSPAILKAAPMGSKDHVAVIGAGVFGAWCAHHLNSAGHKVT
uniref:twin-arginine translocation signal domain-containing protein n=1 Tax=Sphingomonas sp. TaxID=28214 RepID=UPI00286E0737